MNQEKNIFRALFNYSDFLFTERSSAVKRLCIFYLEILRQFYNLNTVQNIFDLLKENVSSSCRAKKYAKTWVDSENLIIDQTDN